MSLYIGKIQFNMRIVGNDTVLPVSLEKDLVPGYSTVLSEKRDFRRGTSSIFSRSLRLTLM